MINSVFVTTIERSKKHRMDNLKKIEHFAKKNLKCPIQLGGVDGSQINKPQIESLIKLGRIKPSKEADGELDLNKMVYLDGFNIKRFLSDSEIGIYLSHTNFWVNIVKNKIPYSLIFEDDAYFDDKELTNTIKFIMKNKPDDKFFHVSLFRHPKQKDNKPYIRYNEHYDFIDPRCWGAVAYIISYEGAKQLLRNIFPIKVPLDYAMNNYSHQLKKGFLLKKDIITLCDNNTFINGDPVSRQGNNLISGNNAEINEKPEIKKINKIDEIKNAYIVTIDRCKELREKNLNKIKSKMNNLEVKTVGVDGRNLSKEQIEKLMIDGTIEPSRNANITLDKLDEIIYMQQFNRFLKAGEIGCYLSHIEIWKDIVKNNIPYALVFEDDATFMNNNFNEHLKIIMNSAPENFTTISLFKSHKQLDRQFLDYNETFHLVDPETWGTVSYIISLDGAKRLLTFCNKIVFPVDFSMHLFGNKSKTSYLYREKIIDHLDDFSIIDACNKYNVN